MTMKPQKAVLLAALIIIVFTAQLFAEEAKCTLIKVASKGMKLTDVYPGKIKDALVVQLVNGIKNPYELKEGLKLIIPEKEFIEKAAGLETADMAKEIASYRERIPAKILKEVAESANGPENASGAAETREAALKAAVRPSSAMKNMQGNKPEEIEMKEFPRKFKHR